MFDPLFLYILTSCMVILALGVAAGDFSWCVPSKNKLRCWQYAALRHPAFAAPFAQQKIFQDELSIAGSKRPAANQAG
jgi:hypothetical protein